MIFDLIAIIGIGLEIMGFVWLLRWSDVTRNSITSWFGNHRKPDPVNDRKTTMDAQVTKIYAMYRQSEVMWNKDTKEFVRFIRNRKNWAIKLVIIGLASQILQIVGTNLSLYF